MKIQVLGPGCMKCNKLYEEAQKAIGLANVTAELEKIDKIDQIMKFGIAITPALIINGQIKASGKVPKADQIAAWLKEMET
ncbi:MAG: TM0996/MTH895 family glutaredoxin-like protein [Deltaproteobacteria bacterium]|nr:TM0996/MTH895 family glutaredoxin-like protein [Deltaproteobacteria bacterium]